jgi:hypothetical protein
MHFRMCRGGLHALFIGGVNIFMIVILEYIDVGMLIFYFEFICTQYRYFSKSEATDRTQ